MSAVQGLPVSFSKILDVWLHREYVRVHEQAFSKAFRELSLADLGGDVFGRLNLFEYRFRWGFKVTVAVWLCSPRFCHLIRFSNLTLWISDQSTDRALHGRVVKEK